MATARIKVLLAGDHTMLRQGLRSALQIYPSIQVVGEAGNGEEAIRNVEKLGPAVVVMDINMPKLDGITATQRITTLFPHVRVLCLSGEVDDHVSAMKKAGAVAVLTKDLAIHDLYRAIQNATASIPSTRVMDDMEEADVVFQVG